MIVIQKDGRIISRSRNLRGVVRYAGKARAYVRRVHILSLPQGAALVRVRWTDGACAVARFSDCNVAQQWVRARRGWGVVPRFSPLEAWHAPTRRDLPATLARSYLQNRKRASDAFDASDGAACTGYGLAASRALQRYATLHGIGTDEAAARIRADVRAGRIAP